MKKIFKLFTVALCAVLAAIALASCGEAGAPTHDVSTEKYVVTSESCEKKLEDFVTNYADRTAASAGEELAAEYLQQQLVECGLTSPVVTSFEFTENSKKKTSHNVSAVYTEDGATDNVIIGAYYDNCYALIPSGSTEQVGAEGALANGSGVAAVLAIAEYLGGDHAPLGFNVTIAFFGSSAIGTTGANEFYKKMDRSQRNNTVLMVELQRLGVDHVYAYCGAPSGRETFFDRVASENGFDIYKTTQKSPHVLGMSMLDGVPYYQWAQTGLYGSFYNDGIPTLNLVGANWETIDLTDTESAFNSEIAFTSGDTLANLKRMYPDYGSKIALASSLVIRSLHDGEFLAVMKADKAAFDPNTALNKGWIWALVLLGVLIIAYIVMNFVVKRMGRKYPVPIPQPKKIKMAVFGVDYEDKDPNDIYIDINDPFANDTTADEIFPGVPNNTKTPMPERPPTVITPIPFRMPENADTEKQRNDSYGDVFDMNAAEKKESDDPFAAAPDTTDSAEKETERNLEGKTEDTAPADGTPSDKEKEQKGTDGIEDESGVPEKTEKKPAAKKPETKSGLTDKTVTKKPTAKKSGLTGKAATTGKTSTRTQKPKTEKSDADSGENK